MNLAKTAAVISFALLMWVTSAQAQLPFGPDLLKQQLKQEPGLRITGLGRFQIFVSPSIKDHTFMIDTDTGKIWIFDKDHATGKYSLERVPVEQVDAGPNNGQNSEKKKGDGKTSSGSGS